MNKTIKIIALALVIMFSITSFSYSEESTTQTSEKTNSDITDVVENIEADKEEKLFEIPNDSIVLAKVNDHEILASEVNDLFHFLSQQYLSSGIDTNSYDVAIQIYNMALDTAIQKFIVLQKAKELGLDTPSEEEKIEIENNSRELFDNTFNSLLSEKIGENTSEEEKEKIASEIKAEMQEAGFSVENIIRSSMDDYAIKKIQTHIIKDIDVSDEEINAKYQEKVESDKNLYASNILYYEQAIMQQSPTWYTPAGYRGIKHILLNVDEELLSSYNSLKAELEEKGNIHKEGNELAENEEETKIKQEDLDEIKNKILDSVKDKITEIEDKIKNNISFDELLAEYGNDPGMNIEPYKSEGYRVNSESFLYDPAFTEAAFTINAIGEYSNPIIGMYGVHILYYASDIPEGPVVLDDSNKEIIKEAALGSKKAEAIDNALKAWTEEFKIEKTEIK